MKNIDIDKLWVGILLGLIAPFLALIAYYQINFSFMSTQKFINHIKLGDSYTAIISLCVLANLVAFYPFIWKAKYIAARGVLFSTFIWAGFVVFLKFYT